ncbi:MAG TPA: hypothetical protein VNL91_01610, partial [Thermoanaerobaculia bacterium]|nr:hypothetical protein [Thermoanaerobaculia bacterium]
MRIANLSLSLLALVLASSLPAAERTPASDSALRGPTNQILIPAAGNVAGANGTFFRSDITITNFRDADQIVAIQWLPQGRSGAALLGGALIIPARTMVAAEDFVERYVGQTGLGAILITAVTPQGTLDPNGLLYSTSRIWTPQPGGAAGTLSQTFPVLPTGAISAAPQVTLHGLRIDSRYRTNVGIVNLDLERSHTFEILQNTDDPTLLPVVTTVIVPPFAMQQVALPNMRSSALQIVVTPKTAVDRRHWVAYGSS